MTNHRCALLVVGHGFLRSERAAHQRLDSEHTEELRIHGGQPPVLCGGTWRDRRFPAAVGGHRLERHALVAPIPIVGDRHLTLGAPCDEKRRAKRHDSIGASIGQRLQEHAVHDAEHRRVGADPERHDGNGEDRKARTAPQRASGIPEIAPELGGQVSAPQVATLLFALVDRAHRAQRGVACLLEASDQPSGLLGSDVPGGTAPLRRAPPPRVCGGRRNAGRPEAHGAATSGPPCLQALENAFGLLCFRGSLPVCPWLCPCCPCDPWP